MSERSTLPPPNFFEFGRHLWDIQEGNPYYNFFSHLVDKGVHETYEAVEGSVQAAKKRHVIVVGCGVGGLAAAHELCRGGHTVTIIEKQNRAGGRLKTWRAPKFAPGVFGEAGGMRLKGVSPVPETNHFIVDHYVDKFQLHTSEFHNDTPEGFMVFFDKPPIKITDWHRQENKMCSEFWPGWDAHLSPEQKQEITTPTQLWKKTFAALSQELLDELDKDQEDPDSNSSSNNSSIGSSSSGDDISTAGWVRW